MSARLSALSLRYENRTEPLVSDRLAILVPRKSSLDDPKEPRQPTAQTLARTEVDTVKSGLEFKGPRRASSALIFGRGVKTLTFILRSPALPLHLLKRREEAHTVCRGETYIYRVCAAYIFVNMRIYGRLCF